MVSDQDLQGTQTGLPYVFGTLLLLCRILTTQKGLRPFLPQGTRVTKVLGLLSESGPRVSLADLVYELTLKSRRERFYTEKFRPDGYFYSCYESSSPFTSKVGVSRRL